MLTYGTTTLDDLLSWIVVGTLAAKLAATAILLAVDRTARDRPGWGTILWWVTKLTPIPAVLAVAALAVLQRDRDLLWLALGLAGFVAVAVPWKVRGRRARIAAVPRAG